MLHFLAVLAIATLLIIGWIYGGLFACVFLSIAPALGLIILALQQLPGGSPSSPAWAVVCAILLVVIWTPRVLWRQIVFKG